MRRGKELEVGTIQVPQKLPKYASQLDKYFSILNAIQPKNVNQTANAKATRRQ